MPKICLFLIFAIQLQTGFTQADNAWIGTGEYLPGQSMTTVMRKMAADKKLVFRVASDGSVSGEMVTHYNKSKAAIPYEGDDQHFSVSGRYDPAKALLLLVITHFRSKPNSIESYLTFRRPDSIYYDLSSSQQNEKVVTTGVANKIRNKNTTAEWVGSFMGGGLGMNVKDNISMHILPLRIRFENNGPSLSMEQVPEPVKKDTATATAASKNNAMAFKSLIRDTKIQKTIVLDTSFIKIDLYDNGEIDGDIATLILDGRPILNKQMLASTPSTVYLNLRRDSEHTLELFADNMGSIPPNTALMILTCRNKRYEVFLSSNESTNGAVRLVFKN